MSAVNSPIPPQVEALYSDHHSWLKSWLLKKLGCTEHAADLAHDTFVRLIASRRVLSGEPRAFLTHVAKGLLIDHWRRKEVERAYLEAITHLLEPEAPSPEQGTLIIESLLQIDAMLSALKGPTREIFLLAQLDGLRYSEIASQLGLSLVTVKRHMRKAFFACLTAVQ